MLRFHVICDILEEVQNAQGLSSKKAILKKGFAKIKEDTDFNIQANFEKFYQGIRLIIPETDDHGRKTFNMKENKMARTIIKMLNLGEGDDKKTLLSYNRVSNTSSFDFADIVHTILRKYISVKTSIITVSELNHDLDLIANRDSDSNLDEIMLGMFRKMTYLETKWIIRIMLKKLKLGIDKNKILNIFHPDAVEYYSSNNSLKKVCETLWSLTVNLSELNLMLFEPFQPMLSKRCDAQTFLKDFPENEKYFVETKFDGERFQLHMKEGKFKYFSRNGYDYTDQFGADFTIGTLTQRLKDVFSDNVRSIILDGEMMLWHKKKKKFGSKGMTLDVKKLNIMNDYCYQPCFCVFDILLLNDRILTKVELQERLKLLNQTVKMSIEDKCVTSFGRVSSGLNLEEVEIVNNKFTKYGVPKEEFQTKTKGKLHFGKDFPDVWLEPENTLVFTVRATELIRCSDESFRTSYTIRFPRILKVRDDKPYEDCLSMSELLDLCQKNKAVIKLNKRHLELEEIIRVKKPKKMRMINVDLDSLKKSGNFLNGIKFFVMTHSEGLPIGKIEELVGRYGGTFSLHMEESVNIVLVGVVTKEVLELLKKDNKFDVVTVKWLERVTKLNRLPRYEQDEVIHIGTSYYNCLADNVDMYGDSYTEETNTNSLKTRFEYMAISTPQMNLNNSILFKADLPLFNKFIAYFDSHEVIGDHNSKLIYNSFLDEIEFKYRLGKVSNTFDPAVNLIVVETRNIERREILQKYATSMNCKHFQVIENSQLYSEDEF